MQGDASVRDLGDVCCQPLQAAVAELDAAAWQAEAYRQDTFEMHSATESVLLLFLDVDDWPRLNVRRADGWKWLGTVALALMERVVAANYAPGGTFLRAMTVRLPAAARIAPHRDKHVSFRHSHRIHVPLSTNSRVRFLVDGAPHRLLVGRAYEIDNQRPHSVLNNGAAARDHFIFDYLPPGALAAPGLARQDAC